LKEIRNRYLQLQGGGLSARFNPLSSARKEFDYIVRNAIFLDHVPPHITQYVRGIQNGCESALKTIANIQRTSGRYME
jgi:hypothetical protein